MTTQSSTNQALKQLISTQQEHPFAQYIRILGRGKKGSRSLTNTEAFDAFEMILSGKALPEQVGAFMMLLRVQGESVEELVGFVQAVKQSITKRQQDSSWQETRQTGSTIDKDNINSNINNNNIHIDLDWSSYAGKSKHHAWYLLSALTLAKHGIKVCMHGAKGHTLGRVYSEDLLQAMGQPIAENLADVSTHLNTHNFCYIPLSVLEPTLSYIIDMRHIFGVRSPVHTIARLMNPFNAPVTLQSIFHPNYQPSHLQAGKLLGYQNSMVIRGDGGEFERNPTTKTRILGLRDGNEYQLRVPRLTYHPNEKNQSTTDVNLSDSLLLKAWEGDMSFAKAETTYATHAIIDTLALVLVALKKVTQDNAGYQQAVLMAEEMWHTRHS